MSIRPLISCTAMFEEKIRKYRYISGIIESFRSYIVANDNYVSDQ